MLLYYLSIFFLSNKTFRHRILSSSYRCQASILYTPWEGPSILWKEKPRCYNCCLFPFFIFSISHSNVIHREICVKDFSGTAAPRILKFGTNVGYDLLYCVKANQHAAAYHSPYLSIFSFSPSKFLSFYDSQSLRILYRHWEDQVYCGSGNKTEIYFALFLLFSIYHANVIHREICDKYFS